MWDLGTHSKDNAFARFKCKHKLGNMAYISDSQPVGRDTSGGIELQFQRDHLRPSENTGIYVTIHNSVAELQL